ncbi:MAG: magnesium transporter [Nitrospinales bacterium]
MQDNLDENDEHFTLSDSDIHHIEEGLASGDKEAVDTAISDLNAPDFAELLEKVSGDNRQKILEEHRESIDSEVFVELNPELCKDTLSEMNAPEVAAIVSDLDSDDALEIIENLEPEFQSDIIHKLSADIREPLEEGLSFPEKSAGRLMQRKFVAIPQFWTVDQAINFLQEASDDELPENLTDLFILTSDSQVTGRIPLHSLLRAKRNVVLETLTPENIQQIAASMNQEEVAQLFRREDLCSAPVVDDEKKLIGVITIDDVIDVIDEEAQDDILKLAGVQDGGIYRDVISISNSRFRWLFVNLLTAIMASLVISLFDATIDQIVALAILMPIVASMGGNAGTQALTVAVRALAMREVSSVNAKRVIIKETLVGLLNGVVFAFIIGLITFTWFSNAMLGIIIAFAMLINLIVAGLFGAGIPIILNRMGSDPAVSSTVLLTTITDVIGFFIFLGLASIFLV